MGAQIDVFTPAFLLVDFELTALLSELKGGRNKSTFHIMMLAKPETVR